VVALLRVGNHGIAFSRARTTTAEVAK